MFLGMAISLPMHFLNESNKRRQVTKRGYSAIGVTPPMAKVPTSTYFLLAIPSLFDLAATALAMFGLTYVTVSVYQMLRGGAIVFVAVLKHFVLQDKLLPFMWVGVALNVVSIVMVGATANDDGNDEATKSPLVGVGLILSGAIVQSLQYAFEEKVMSSSVGAPPLLVIAMEGIWGLLVCMLILYPVCYATGVEDPADTWVMLKNSRDIQIVFAFYFVTVFVYNFLAILVTFMLNSVWKAILDNFRPITVWASDLVIFYFFTQGQYGERLCFPSFYVQLAALAVLLYGTAVYNGSVRLPGLSYPEDVQPTEPVSILASPLVVRASPALASNALLRSPLIHGGQAPPGLAQYGAAGGIQLQTGRPRSNSK